MWRGDRWWRMREQLEPRKISELLPAVLRKLGLEEKAANVTLGPLWREVVGPSVGSHTKPVQFQRGCLMVAVDTPVWKMELDRHYKREILGKLSAKDARIKGLRFHVDQLS